MTLRIVARNVHGGSHPGVIDVLRDSAADLVVLSDCHPTHYLPIANALRAEGFSWLAGTNGSGYTGLLIASRQAIRPGHTQSSTLPAHWLHVVLPEAGMSVVGVYGPLYRAGVSRLVPRFWEGLLEAAEALATSSTLIVGDLNTAPAAGDSSTRRLLQAARYLQKLQEGGWRDAYREVHGAAEAYSYWNYQGSFRIDHAMLSPQAPPVIRVEYVTEAAGLQLRAWPKQPGVSTPSDHALLRIEL